ncbi:putative serine/threonine-protein kinase SBK2-like [Scophthalmus maximus]|uniref:Putative serine/threonine-protein kinase SBK2-like n=1 Tax=Scophthalmus maximus TaxID=52904 RepID=A0A2U9CWZ1_SCOMX|nr:putative serine/threonine-protein kinase SBK2-like [Scophthalmus maximus]
MFNALDEMQLIICDSAPCLLHLLLLAELFVPSSSGPAHSSSLCGLFRSMTPRVETLTHLSKKLHELSDNEVLNFAAVEKRLDDLPHMQHTAAHIPSLEVNESLSQLHVFIQSFKLHVDWLKTAKENFSLPYESAEGASTQLLLLSNLLNMSLHQAATKLLDEMCHLTAQSLTAMDTSEHFKVLKLLGEGSYGKVMLAVHRKRGTPMALKFFPRESTSLFSFLREYNLSLSFCTHPSLTRALGIAYSTPSHYVFAQQAGLFGDLYDVILPEVGVEEDCCQRVVSQLCGALSHLHSLGFVHRDLKPENVFLCDSACRWVKLGDFGMVKARGTRVPEVWYSSPYCTPEAEVARGNEDSSSSMNDVKEDEEEQKKTRVWVSVESSTDSWALGILTYAMLTGSHPWAETVADCRSYLKYWEWFDRVKGREDELDVWAEPQTESAQDAIDLHGPDRGKKDSPPVAPQFACFTPLACSLFLSLLDPRPLLRGQPEDAPIYEVLMYGAWKVMRS